MSQQSDREAMTRYRVRRLTNTRGQSRGHYQIAKHVIDVEVDTYNVTVKPATAEGSRELSLWCECLGFRRQTYPHIEHKHIRLVLDYQERGEPEWADYKLIGPSRTCNIVFLGDSTDVR